MSSARVVGESATFTITGTIGAGACTTNIDLATTVPAMPGPISATVGGDFTCPTVSSHTFTDVPATSFATNDVACIADLNITTGTTPTTYGPANNVTREQMAAFIAQTWEALGNTCTSDPHGFTDVSATSFATADIACIAALGITTGTTATTYGPQDNVTREQMASFLARLIRANATT